MIVAHMKGLYAIQVEMYFPGGAEQSIQQDLYLVRWTNNNANFTTSTAKTRLSPQTDFLLSVPMQLHSQVLIRARRVIGQLGRVVLLIRMEMIKSQSLLVH